MGNSSGKDVPQERHDSIIWRAIRLPVIRSFPQVHMCEQSPGPQFIHIVNPTAASFPNIWKQSCS
jgi:hypothetical protein